MKEFSARNIMSVHKMFVISLILKMLNAIAEIIGGIGALFISSAILIHIVNLIGKEELVEDPKDAIINYLMQAVQHYNVSVKAFVSAYLLIHGIIKVFLIYNLLKRRVWVYPVAMVVFGLFVAYQVYAYIQNSSVGLIMLTLLDIVVITLTYLEYRNIREEYNWVEKPVTRTFPP